MTLGPRFGNRQVIDRRARSRAIASWSKALQKARPGSPLKVVAVTLEDFDRPGGAGQRRPRAPAAAAN